MNITPRPAKPTHGVLTLIESAVPRAAGQTKTALKVSDSEVYCMVKFCKISVAASPTVSVS